MKRFNNTIAMLMAGLMVVSSGVFVACDEDDYSTNQIKGGVSLTAAQLQVTRGGYMTFKGSGLDKVESIIFPGDVVVNEIEVVDQYTIRCIVPEAAEPGVVQLVSGDIVLETKEIAFTEPITFTSFAPAAVKAGDVLTIKGTYLNLITHVKFATGEYVPVEGTRYEIKVTVPVDASTGVVAVAQETIVDEEATYNEIPAEGELVVAEPEATLSAKVVKPGQELTISGSLLRLVKSVTLPGAKAVEVAQADPTKEVASIKVEVPATTVAGEVMMELLSGIEVSAGEISIAETTAAIADKKDSYGVDEVVVITGANLDIVSQLAFAGTDAVDVAASATGDTITVKVPQMAQSGNITLTTLNGSTVEVEGFVTTKPVFTFPASATPLDVLTVESTLANRVVKVLFGSLEVEAKSTDDAFTVTVPLDAETGKVVVVMDNGEELPAIDFSVNAFTFCAVSEFTTETVTIGDLLKCIVKNGSNLTGVLLNGETTSYILNGNVLFVNVGNSVGLQTITLVSGESKVDYSVKVVASGLVETVVYDIPINITGWSGVVLDYQFELPLPANSKIRFHIAQANSDLQIMDAYWGMGPNWAITDNALKNNIAIPAADMAEGILDIDIPNFHDENGNAWWDGKLMFNGNGVIISSISIIVDYSAPTPIWTGSFSNAGWAGNQDLAWGGYDWTKVFAGQTLYFTVEKVNAGKWGCLSLRVGNGWGNLVDAPNQYDLGDDVDTAVIEFVLTQAAIDDLIANSGLVMTGDNLTITKVAIK